jgi:hypothetical protein
MLNITISEIKEAIITLFLFKRQEFYSRWMGIWFGVQAWIQLIIIAWAIIK